MAQAPDADCASPSEANGIPAAIDAAIIGPADKDGACMKARRGRRDRVHSLPVGGRPRRDDHWHGFDSSEGRGGPRQWLQTHQAALLLGACVEIDLVVKA